MAHGRALFWPAERALLVADLHLEKASWFARTGQMLPLTTAAKRSGGSTPSPAPRMPRVLCLGDNFHDAQGPPGSIRWRPIFWPILPAARLGVDYRKPR
jgi:metallophosphoesterase superfamily enzyme